jgi:hypothetical protein
MTNGMGTLAVNMSTFSAWDNGAQHDDIQIEQPARFYGFGKPVSGNLTNADQCMLKAWQ